MPWESPNPFEQSSASEPEAENRPLDSIVEAELLAFTLSENLEQNTKKLLSILGDQYYNMMLTGTDNYARLLLVVYDDAERRLTEAESDQERFVLLRARRVIDQILNMEGLPIRSLDQYDLQ